LKHSTEQSLPAAWAAQRQSGALPACLASKHVTVPCTVPPHARCRHTHGG
jgi:hypothetical protein